MKQTTQFLCSAAVIIAACAAAPSHAAIGALSRANCIGFVNESVTYDRPGLVPFYGGAGGTHVAQGNIEPLHHLSDGSDGTMNWRFYAGDTDDSEVVTVYGGHSWYFVDAAGVVTGSGYSSTEASDCNLTEW